MSVIEIAGYWISSPCLCCSNKEGEAYFPLIEEEIPFLKEFLKKNHQELSSLFQQEKERLAEMIGEILFNG